MHIAGRRPAPVTQVTIALSALLYHPCQQALRPAGNVVLLRCHLLHTSQIVKEQTRFSPGRDIPQPQSPSRLGEPWIIANAQSPSSGRGKNPRDSPARPENHDSHLPSLGLYQSARARQRGQPPFPKDFRALSLPHPPISHYTGTQWIGNPVWRGGLRYRGASPPNVPSPRRGRCITHAMELGYPS